MLLHDSDQPHVVLRVLCGGRCSCILHTARTFWNAIFTPLDCQKETLKGRALTSGTVPWLRLLVVALSPRRPGVQSQTSLCRVYGVRCDTGTGVFPSTSVFPSQYHSTGAHAHSSVSDAMKPQQFTTALNEIWKYSRLITVCAVGCGTVV
jgi:hypothetical protein